MVLEHEKVIHCSDVPLRAAPGPSLGAKERPSWYARYFGLGGISLTWSLVQQILKRIGGRARHLMVVGL
jgi:hypothetical protein